MAGDGYAPMQAPYSVGDTVTGYLLLAQINAALYRRSQTGKGDYVRSGLYHNAIFTMGTMQIITQKPFGYKYPFTRVDHGVPGGQYQCSDGEWIFIATSYAALLIPKLCKAIGRPDLIDDPRYSTPSERWKNRYEYYEIFREAFLQKTCAEWLKIAEEYDLPMMRMAHFADVSEDEQAWANDYLEHVAFKSGNVDVMPRSPIEMDSVGKLTTKTAPGIGAHTHEILQHLGYSEDDIRKMTESGAVK